jgi:dTMP kinase
MFITFEGSEGSGKTSQMKLLVDFLTGQGYPILHTREPGGTLIGDQVRNVIVSLSNTGMLPRTEILLFQASRAQLVGEVIRPFLQTGGVVLCDRYGDSTLAYQGYGYQNDLAQLRQLVEFATGGLKPDLTLLLDVDVDEGLRRRAKSGGWNRLDAYDPEFYRRVRAGYLEMVRLEPERWIVIDANQPYDRVQQKLREVVLNRLKEAGYRPFQQA